MYKRVPVLTLEEVSLVTKTALEVVIYFNCSRSFIHLVLMQMLRKGVCTANRVFCGSCKLASQRGFPRLFMCVEAKIHPYMFPLLFLFLEKWHFIIISLFDFLCPVPLCGQMY